MTDRERFLRYMQFQSVDRIPLMEMGVWDESLERWHGEGLPPWVTSLRHLEDYLGLDLSFNINWLPINHEFYPRFEEKVVAETETTIDRIDALGVLFRERKHGRSFPQYLRFPIENEADYDNLRPRLANGSNPGRYPDDFDDDLKWRRHRGEIVGANFRSFFGMHRNLMGVENWCMAFYDNPELVRRMIADRLQFAKDLFARVLSSRAVDFVQIWEDMCFKTSSLISPALVREYMLPAYRELVAYLREGGVQVIMVDTDGHMEDLMPIFLEAGMDGSHPCEMAAGSDPVMLRERFPDAALIGGMDKRIIARGPAGVDAEIERIRPLVDQGAYIPMLDHYVPSDVSYDTYCYYVEQRRILLNRPYAGRPE